MTDDILLEIYQHKRKKDKIKREKALKRLKNPIPIIQNPIDFVNFFEIEQPKNKSKEVQDKFILYKHLSNIQFTLFLMEPLIDLTREIFKYVKQNEITSLIVKYDLIAIGDISGKVKIFSLSQKKFLMILYCPIKSSEKNVTCLDFSEDGRYIFVGYVNGSIGIFDLNNGKNKFLTDQIHKKTKNQNNNAVLDMKIINFQDSIFDIISSDSNGNVQYSQILIGYFNIFKMIGTSPILTQNYPIYFIKIITFSEEKIYKYPFLNNLGKYALLGNLESVILCQIKPKMQFIYTMERPDNFSDLNNPDANIDIGKPIDRGIYDNNSKNMILLVISWGKVVYIHELVVENNEIVYGNLIGHYINNNFIERIGFLSNSTLYCYDVNKTITILNTRKFIPGDLKISNDLKEPIKIENNDLAIIEYKTSIDIKSQKSIISKLGHIKDTYFYSISENNNCIFLFAKNQLLFCKLSNWNDYLESLQRRDLWKDVLAIAVGIYIGKCNSFLDIPENENEKKNIIGTFLKQSISQYVVHNTGKITTGTNFYYNENDEETSEMSECIDITIEACLTIENFNFLFQDLEPIFENKNYSQLFISNLEPFILSDKIKDFSLNESIILKLIDLYIEKDDLNLLSQLLLHIDINSLDTPAIKKKLEELELITPLIYLYMNGKEQNYFYPIEKLNEIYQKSTPFKNFTEYHLLENVTIEEVLSSKQYIGHKILWYLKLCLSERKFPNIEEKMDEKLFKELIPKIVIWMLSEKNLYEFCKFDPENYFMILKNIFSIEKLLSILKDFANENEENKIEGMLLSNKIAKLKDSQPISYINYIIKMIKELNKGNILLYLYDFLIKITPSLELSKEIILESATFIFQNYNYLIRNKNKMETKQICDNLKDIFESREDFTENELIQLIQNSKDHLFDEIVLYVYQKFHKYTDCLNTFLDEKLNIDNEKKSKNCF